MIHLKSVLFLFAIITIDASVNGQCNEPAPVYLTPQTCGSGSYPSPSQVSYPSPSQGSCQSSSQVSYPSPSQVSYPSPSYPSPSQGSYSSDYNCQSATTTQKPKVFVNKQPPIVVNRPGKCYTIPAGKPIVVKPAPVIIQRQGQNQHIPISVTVTGKPILINKKIVKIERPVVKKYYVESHTEQQPNQECPDENAPLPPVDRCASVPSQSSNSQNSCSQSSYSQSSYSQSSEEQKPSNTITLVPSSNSGSYSAGWQSQPEAPCQAATQLNQQQSPLSSVLNAATSALGQSGSGQSMVSNIINALSSAFSSSGGVNGCPSAGLGDSLIKSVVGSPNAGLGKVPLEGLIGSVPSALSSGSCSSSVQPSCSQQSDQSQQYQYSVPVTPVPWAPFPSPCHH